MDAKLEFLLNLHLRGIVLSSHSPSIWYLSSCIHRGAAPVQCQVRYHHQCSSRLKLPEAASLSDGYGDSYDLFLWDSRTARAVELLSIIG